MAGSDESKYRIDPNITTKIMDSKGVNYGHAISKMFDTLGDIEVKKKESAQKAEDRALTQESLKLGIDNAKKDQIIKGISVQSIQDKLEDEKVVGGYIASDYTDWNTYAKDKGVKLRSPEMMQSVAKLSDERYNKLMDENWALHEGYLKEQGKFLDAKGNIDMSAVREQLKLDPTNNIGLAQAAERKYGVKIDKPAESLSAKDQAAILASQSTVTKNNALAKKYDWEMKSGGSKGDGGVGAGTNEIKNYTQYANAQKGRGVAPLPFDEWYDKEKNSKTMGMGLRDIEYADGKLNDALITKDKVKMQSAANLYARANPDVKNVDKVFRAIAPTAYQLEEAQKLIQTKGAGVGDEMKNLFSQYTGLGWDETTQEGRTAFLSILQPLAKANITGSVSDRDMKMLQDGFATMYKSDKAVATAMRNKLEQIVATLKPYAQAHPQYAEARGYDVTLNLLEGLSKTTAGNNTRTSNQKSDGFIAVDDILSTKPQAQQNGENVPVSLFGFHKNEPQAQQKQQTQQPKPQQPTNSRVNSVEDFDKLLGF